MTKRGGSRRISPSCRSFCASRVSASIFDIGQGTLGLEDFSYGSTVVMDGALLRNLGPLNGGPFFVIEYGDASPHWVKVENPNAPAVKREAEEDWGR